MHPPLVKGWDFTPAAYHRAWKEGSILTASMETGPGCDLDCYQCFKKDLVLQTMPTPEPEKRLITTAERLQIIDTLAAKNVQTINVAGAGEPTIYKKDLTMMLERMAFHGITPLVATHAGFINDYWIDLFNKTGTSVMVKFNSFNPTKQDLLVNSPGYAARRDRGIKQLLKAGFNLPGEGYQTRLSFNAYVDKNTITDIPEIFTYCREHNIMPCMEAYIPDGRTAESNGLEVSKEEFIALAERFREEDKRRGIMYSRVWPYLGGVPCTQQGKASVFVDTHGDIYDCPARATSYGTIDEPGIEKAFEHIKQHETNYCLGCPARDKQENLDKHLRKKERSQRR